MISWYFQHLGVNQINLTETFLVKWAPVFESVFLVVTKTLLKVEVKMHPSHNSLEINHFRRINGGKNCCHFWILVSMSLEKSSSVEPHRHSVSGDRSFSA